MSCCGHKNQSPIYVCVCIVVVVVFCYYFRILVNVFCVKIGTLLNLHIGQPAAAIQWNIVIVNTEIRAALHEQI